MTNWKKKRNDLLVSGADATAKRYAKANGEAVEGTLAGRGPDDTEAKATAGARVVFNIPCVHVAAFVASSIQGDPKPYKNGYDLGKLRVGEPPPGESLGRRERVDRSLPLPDGAEPGGIYFAAVELNGTGIRFYGDYCLVLRGSEIAADTVVLYRNSYDLIRSPIREEIEEAVRQGSTVEEAMRAAAAELKGTWKEDLAAMATVKMLREADPSDRRMTTGAISDGLLSDEDYLEVLYCKSFRAEDLQEVRCSAADAAEDALISDRWRVGPCPALEALVWQENRRKAEQFLNHVGVPIQIITTTGRVRS